MPRHGISFAGSVDACPTVDPVWAKARLEKLGVRVERFEIDRTAFEDFLQEARFPAWYHSGGRTRSAAFLEKTLEHFVASRLLEIAPGDVYIDVGADNSPFGEIAERLYGCQSFQLDTAYRRGAHGRFLGCDAGEAALPPGSVDKMAAHCAFDHFQGDMDRASLEEAARLLRPGGRLCLIPLYLDEVTTNYVDPSAWLLPPRLDDTARVVEVPRWGYEFSRYYSPEAFVALAASQPALSLRVIEIAGARAVDEGCYVRLAALFERD